MSRKPHTPTPTTRQLVQVHATVGTQHEVISSLLGIDRKTLMKYYRAELDESLAQANATIGGALFNQAKNGNVAAMIFWLKTRARWREIEREKEIDPALQKGEVTSVLVTVAAASPERGDEKPAKAKPATKKPAPPAQEPAEKPRRGRPPGSGAKSKKPRAKKPAVKQ
jgi:hypothetical protein